MSRLYWSIGLIPVQEWIAEARRSRDLQMGSRLLSWTMARVLERLPSEKAEIVLPSLEPERLDDLAKTQPAKLLTATGYSIPNRATGYLAEEPEDVAELFRTLEGVVEASWDDLRDAATAHDPFPRKLRGKAWSKLRPHVVDTPCPFTLVWCVEPAGASDAEPLRSVNRLYTAVKRSRPIRPHRGLPVGKCEQCGWREAMGGSDWQGWREFHAELGSFPEILRGYRFDAGERLCAVCAVKRLAAYLSVESFPSTSQIAAGEWLYRIEQLDDLRDLLHQLNAAARRCPGYDEPSADTNPLLFRRTLERHLRDAEDPDREPFEATRERLVELQEAVARRERDEASFRLRGEPSSYLAVLVFDGDDMGEAVQERSGEVPGQLARFATTLLGELEEGREQPFYVGGDEGLVLAPLEGAMELPARIREVWERTVTAPAPGSDGEPLTLSMGMALFDRERPLGVAIDAARAALRRGKELDGKSALAVTVQTASGSTWTAVDTWGQRWSWVSRAVAMIRRGRLAAGWAHDVEAFLRTLPEEVWRQGDASREAVREEVRRITHRRVPPRPPGETGGDAGEGESSRQARAAAIWSELGGESWWASQPERPQTMAEQLHLVAFLVREAGLAVPDGEAGEAA